MAALSVCMKRPHKRSQANKRKKIMWTLKFMRYKTTKNNIRLVKSDIFMQVPILLSVNGYQYTVTGTALPVDYFFSQPRKWRTTEF